MTNTTDIQSRIATEVAKLGRATTPRQQRMIERRLQNLRLEQGRAEVEAVVATGKCPRCGSPLRRNLSMSGWWQCEQLGAPSYRARPDEDECGWQGFTS